MVDQYRVLADVEQIGGKGADDIDRNPRRAEVGVDIAGEDVLRLDRLKRLDVAFDPRFPRRCQLPPDVPGQVSVAGFIGAGFGVEEDQLAQLGQNSIPVLAVQRRDIAEIDPPALIERDQQAFLRRRNRRDGRSRPDHVLQQDSRFRGLPRRLVIFLEGHDQKGVRILAKPDQVRHAPDLVSLRVHREGRLVDRAIERDEGVIGPVQPPAGIPALILGPSLILGPQDLAGAIAQLDQRGQPAAHLALACAQSRLAMHDREDPPALDLQDRPILDQERPFAETGGDRDGLTSRLRRNRGRGEHAFGQASQRAEQPILIIGRRVHLERVPAIAAAPDGEFAHNHVRALGEPGVHLRLAIEREGNEIQPVARMILGRARMALAEEDDVGNDGRALILEGLVGQADRAEEVGLRRQIFAGAPVQLVEREPAGDERQHAAGRKRVNRLGEEIIVQGKPVRAMLVADVRERHVADHSVDGRKAAVPEIFDPDIMAGIERAGDPAGNAIHLDADKAHAGRRRSHEAPGSASRLKHERAGRQPETVEPGESRAHDDRRRVEGVEGRAPG